MARNIKQLPLDLIKFDQNNVRFGGDVAESQKEALEFLMNDPVDAKKIYNLTKHIAEFGLDPTELQLVYLDDDKKHYVVTEGNRRLAALKLLIKPDLCPVEGRVQSFISLKEQAKYKVPSNLEFSVVASREEGDKWLELKHTGENDGVGRVAWDSDIRDERKSRVSGVESVGRQLRALIASNPHFFNEETKQRSTSIHVTNLTRLFQSLPAQSFFQLEVKSKKLTAKYELKFIAPSVSYALELMSDKNFTVNAIRNGEDREKFIYQIPSEINPVSLKQEADKNSDNDDIETVSDSDIPPLVNGVDDYSDAPSTDTPSEANSNQISGADESSAENLNNAKTTRANPDRRVRIRLIDWPMKITPTRINELFRELRNKLNVFETPNAVAITFRVFLEASCDYYIKHHHDNNNPVVTDDQKKQPVHGNKNIKLAMKVQAIAQHLRDRTLLTQDEAKAIKKRAATQDTVGSVDHLNQFVHGISAMPIATDLNAIADEYKVFLMKIWGD